METRTIFKKIFDEVTVGIFDMSNVRFFKEIEEKIIGDFNTMLCFHSAELSKAFGLRNLCYSKLSVVMLLGYRISGISQKHESERNKYALHPKAACLNS